MSIPIRSAKALLFCLALMVVLPSGRTFGIDLEAVCRQRGEELIREKKYREAAQQFETVVNINPSRAGVFFRLGFCYGRSGELRRAVRALNHSLSLAPGNRSALRLLDSYEKKLKQNNPTVIPFTITAVSVSPEIISAGGSAPLTIRITVQFFDEPGTIRSVTANMRKLDVGMAVFTEDIPGPQVQPGELIFSMKTPIPGSTAPGKYSIPVTALSDEYDAARTSVKLQIMKAEGYTVEVLYRDHNSLQITPGRVVVGGAVLENRSGSILDFTKLDTGKRRPGTDYYVFAVKTTAIQGTFKTVLSASASVPSGHAHSKLIGYLHNNPGNRIIPASVVTNDILDGTVLAPCIPLPGMVKVGSFAMDIYENSPGENGQPVSRYGSGPWMMISPTEVKQLATDIGKRIPSAAEWFQAAAGTPDPDAHDPGDGSEACNIWPGSLPLGAVNTDGETNRPDGSGNQYSLHLTGTASRAVSSCGCYDMIGNAWEWTTERTTTASFMQEGFVSAVGTAGLPMATVTSPVIRFFGDFLACPYPFENLTVARGGGAIDGQKAGLHAVNLMYLPRDAANLFGFRLAR